MGIIKDNKKFERTKTQDNPTSINRNLKENKKFELENETIVEQKENK
ncbi:hypothetical protein H9W90_04290 [Polaribacter pectinis]|uniref:Uncharacterized protein n=1 Tax=Polaribacter pectinis TaxID=2738844 RepID=A0A7G9LCK2_9FLAO|nr:hypothetical protein [Polaribacter pectinis]QNM86351.1 hypothetical protein H9W90_04290 [Polaribacter pectinis]